MICSRPVRWLVLGALLLAGSGCSVTNGSAVDLAALEADLPAARTDASADELRERMAAAREIRDSSMRDAAHAQIAFDAAGSGQVELCLTALGDVKSLFDHDEMAARCALLRHRGAAPAEACKIAEIIRSLNLRDAVFARIAAGSGS